MEQETIDELCAHVDKFRGKSFLRKIVKNETITTGAYRLQEKLLEAYGIKQTWTGKQKPQSKGDAKKANTLAQFLVPFSEEPETKKSYSEEKITQKHLNQFHESLEKYNTDRVDENICGKIKAAGVLSLGALVTSKGQDIGIAIGLIGVVMLYGTPRRKQLQIMHGVRPYFDLYKNAAPKAAEFLQTTYKNHLIEKGLR